MWVILTALFFGVVAGSPNANPELLLLVPESPTPHLQNNVPFTVTDNIMYIQRFPNGRLCSAFFISNNKLLTTASCVYRKKPNELFVEWRDENGSHRSMPVLKTVIHYLYIPYLNVFNIAIVYVEEQANVPIYSLPQGEDVFSVEGTHPVYMPRWVYDPHSEQTRTELFNENFHVYNVTALSSWDCGMLTDTSVSCYYMCVDLEPIYKCNKALTRPGRYDWGTPLTSAAHDYVIGFYSGVFSGVEARYEYYDTIHKYLGWIHSH